MISPGLLTPEGLQHLTDGQVLLRLRVLREERERLESKMDVYSQDAGRRPPDWSLRAHDALKELRLAREQIEGEARRRLAARRLQQTGADHVH